jgi:predicted dehydrogenase
MTEKLKWGILGTGSIAHAFARDIPLSNTGELLAIGSRNRDTAERFGDEFKVPRRFADYQSLLDDPDIQAVYISVLHPWHAEWAIKAAEAGKHILCEKPLAMNVAESEAIIEAARKHNVFLMEAFMYRCHPQIAKMIELLRENAIGEVRLIEATFSFTGDFPLEDRIMNPRLGGGGILDVGCYCTSMCRLVAGVAIGQPFAEPLELMALGHVGAASHVDEYTIASVRFPGQILAHLSTGIQVEQGAVVRIYGTKRRMILPSPWLPEVEGRRPVIKICQEESDEPIEEILVEGGRPLYALEADTVTECLKARQAAWPAMSWEDSLGNMRMLERWLEAIGMKGAYEF